MLYVPRDTRWIVYGYADHGRIMDFFDLLARRQWVRYMDYSYALFHDEPYAEKVRLRARFEESQWHMRVVYRYGRDMGILP